MSDTTGLPIVWEWCQFHNWKHETIPCPTCRAEKAERELASKDAKIKELERELEAVCESYANLGVKCYAGFPTTMELHVKIAVQAQEIERLRANVNNWERKEVDREIDCHGQQRRAEKAERELAEKDAKIADQAQQIERLSELLWKLYEGLYGHRKADLIDYATTAVGAALHVKRAFKEERTAREKAERELAEARKPLPCGHPAQAVATGEEGTSYCRWCNDLALLADARREPVSETTHAELADQALGVTQRELADARKQIAKHAEEIERLRAWKEAARRVVMAWNSWGAEVGTEIRALADVLPAPSGQDRYTWSAAVRAAGGAKE